jgi:hypothetical protein
MSTPSVCVRVCDESTTFCDVMCQYQRPSVLTAAPTAVFAASYDDILIRLSHDLITFLITFARQVLILC